MAGHYTTQEKQEAQSLHHKIHSAALSLRERQSELIGLLIKTLQTQAYLIHGYTSLFAYLHEGLHFPEATAARYNAAARLCLEHPEFYTRLVEKTITLSALSETQRIYSQCKRALRIQSTPKRTQRHESHASPASTKSSLLDSESSKFKKLKSSKDRQAFAESILKKTASERKRYAASLFPPNARKRKIIETQDSVHVHLVFSQSEFKQIKALQALMSHAVPPHDLKAFLLFACEQLAHNNDPEKRAQRRSARTSNTSKTKATASPKSIPRNIYDAVLIRDQKRCQFVRSDGTRCHSRYFVQVDHIIPLSKGGASTLENLRCLCSSHNGRMKDRAEINRVGLPDLDSS